MLNCRKTRHVCRILNIIGIKVVDFRGASTQKGENVDNFLLNRCIAGLRKLHIQFLSHWKFGNGM